MLSLPHFQRRLKDECRIIDQITFGVRELLAGQQMPFDRRGSRDKSNQYPLEWYLLRVVDHDVLVG